MTRSSYLPLCWLFIATFTFVNQPEHEDNSPFEIKVERISSSPKGLLYEVPHWDEETRSLYYADIAVPNSTLLRYDYDEDRIYSAKIDNAPSLLFLLPIKCTKDQFLVGIDREAVIVKWDGRSSKAEIIRTLFEIECDTSNIFNDVKTDEFGRFYGGTKSIDGCAGNETTWTGGFYMYEKGKSLKKLLSNIAVSNGLIWVRNTNKFYYIDSCAYNLKEFDYDPRTGEISHGHPILFNLVNGEKPDYVFDGMTVDTEGNLYIATFGGSKIIKFNPRTRKVLLEIKLPATQVSSVAFGGSEMNILYVTTANEDGKQPSASGYLYKITGLCAQGYPGVRFDLYSSCKKQTITVKKNCYPFCMKGK